jgi:hypothetical protein
VATLPPSASPTLVERRRSQRVHLAIPVEVGWTQEDGAQVNEHAETEVLNAYGALLRMKPHFPIPIDVELSKPREGLSTPARVVGFREPTPKGLLGVAVELATPSETFWGIRFPPVPSTSPS